MSLIPVTSSTLLKDISGDANSARWSEFVARYRPMMESYLRERFPFLEHDDIIQETLLTLVAKLPSYRYVPNETGYFHNYLTGVLRRKALRVCERDKRRCEVMAEYRQEPQAPVDDEREMQSWRDSIYEIALEQALGDESIQNRTKQMFVRTAVNGEKPEEVAESLGVNRNAVDQAKNRMIGKLRTIVEQLESVDVELG